MTDVVINPAFEKLAPFIHSLPERFERIPSIIQNNRNDIRTCEVEGTRVVIKSFRGMYLPNRIAYSLFRKSKAKRSYEFSFRLHEKGFRVPEPVAFIDCYSNGLLTESYYVSLYYDHTPFAAIITRQDEEAKRILREFAHFTYALHKAGIYHPDYSNGNILCNGTNGSTTFALVDLNRIKFKSVSFREGLRNFSTLTVTPETLDIMLNEYGQLAGQEVANAREWIMGLRKKTSKSRRIRKWIKRNIANLPYKVHYPKAG